MPRSGRASRRMWVCGMRDWIVYARACCKSASEWKIGRRLAKSARMLGMSSGMTAVSLKRWGRTGTSLAGSALRFRPHELDGYTAFYLGEAGRLAMMVEDLPVPLCDRLDVALPVEEFQGPREIARLRRYLFSP